ncbi:hypothetical protein ACQ4M3_30245 [Leptolyngbya sp. AN03gr2]|uniref:hypothetical protein n=1 Tax=unclassified Leptolyngbya TaxID=2650499 RepID=UPI003D313CCB
MTQIYTFNQPLPRDPKTGRALPDSSFPHTQLGQRTSRRRNETYTRVREFGENGKLIRDIDFTNHDRADHTNPHQHRYDANTGKRMSAEPISL